MAQTVNSSASSQSRPLLSGSSSDSHPDLPLHPSVYKGGRLDSTAEDCCCASSPSLSPFAAAEEKERFSWEYDPARSLIERMEDEWFRGNVVSCGWGHSSVPSAKVTDGDGAAARDRLEEDSISSQGVRTPDTTGLSASQRDLTGPPSFRSIEMVPPLVTSRSFSGERDTRESRDLPRMRLSRLSRRPGSLDDADMSFFASEQKQCSRASMDEAFHRFRELRIEPSRLGPVMRSKNPENTTVLSRAFLNGDETSCKLNARLSDVREEGENAFEDKLLAKNQVSRQLPGKLPSESGNESLNPLTDRNGTKPPTLRARRRKDRKRRSKSSTDVDFDEMRGCMDLGFKINEDDLTPRPLPGVKDAFKSGDDVFHSPRGMSSPQGWPRRPDSPLFKWPIPGASDSNVDMREHLKQWAHYVASTMRERETPEMKEILSWKTINNPNGHR